MSRDAHQVLIPTGNEQMRVHPETVRLPQPTASKKRAAKLSPHPTYPNPTIQEAVCEFQFVTNEASRWKPNKPAPLLESLGKNYKDFETISEQSIQVVIGPEGPTPKLLPPSLKLKFSHASAPLIVQASKNSFSINALSPYEGWQSLREEIFRVWPAFIKIIKPSEIRRVGMRYINRIVRKNRDESPSYWFKENKYIPSVILSSGPNFMSRLEQRLTDESRLVVTLAHDETNATEHFGSILFDIDRIREGNILIDRKIMETLLDGLHEDIWDVFDAAKSVELERLLKRRGKS